MATRSCIRSGQKAVKCNLPTQKWAIFESTLAFWLFWLIDWLIDFIIIVVIIIFFIIIIIIIIIIIYVFYSFLISFCSFVRSAPIHPSVRSVVWSFVLWPIYLSFHAIIHWLVDWIHYFIHSFIHFICLAKVFEIYLLISLFIHVYTRLLRRIQIFFLVMAGLCFKKKTTVRV